MKLSEETAELGRQIPAVLGEQTRLRRLREQRNKEPGTRKPTRVAKTTAPSDVASRLWRIKEYLRETYAFGGLYCAARLLARLSREKIPMLWRQTPSIWRIRSVRREIIESRRSLPRSHPYCAVAVTGGVGDLVVIARFLRDLGSACGGLSFDVFCTIPERVAWVMQGIPGFKRAYYDILFSRLLSDYDLALQVNQTVAVRAVHWEALRGAPYLARIAERIIHASSNIEGLASQHPFLDDLIAETAVSAGHARRDYLHHMAGVPYGSDLLAIPTDQDTVARLCLEPRGYVTVHNGFDSGFVIAGRRATKCYPHFGPVVATLKKALPELAFVQIGVEGNSERLPQCDIDLVGRTSLRETAGVLAQAAFHIDNDSGLVHLARCYGVRSGVVFGPTPSDYFAYPDNVGIDPHHCGRCWWQTRTWMDVCAEGYSEPRCMSEQEPDKVAARFLAAIQQAEPQRATLRGVPEKLAAIALERRYAGQRSMIRAAPQ